MVNTIVEVIKNLSIPELVYDGLMLLGAMYIFIKLKTVNKNLIQVLNDTEKAYSSTKNEIRIEGDKAIENISRTFNRERHEPIRNNFTKYVAEYIKWSDFITLLPLAGLLGTVLGLVPGLNAVKNSNFDILYSSLSTALTSTAIGLIASILLKIYVAKYPNFNANIIEMKFDQIDREYDIAIGAGRVAK